jgi:membrane-bound lytic murein transglycosylase B
MRPWQPTAATRQVHSNGVRVLAAAVLLLMLPACAASSDPRELFVDRMVDKHGFARREVEGVLAEVVFQQSIIDAISRPAEKALPWRDYRKIFLTDARITQGVAFWAENEAVLAQASERFKVEPQVIVAIIGVETSYGRNTGRYRVLDALGTLAFGYPPRSEFFTSELEQFLLLTREQQIDRRAVLGSYAGAMGYGQFISSSYRNFAVDFSGDGRVDIIGNVHDAIGSVANYFQRHGWAAGQPVILPITAPASAFTALANSGTEPKETLGELSSRALTAGALRPDEKVALFRFDGEQGEEYWAGLQNFHVITRYNRSPMYALAVWQLAQAVQAARQAAPQASPQAAQAPPAQASASQADAATGAATGPAAPATTP